MIENAETLCHLLPGHHKGHQYHHASFLNTQSMANRQRPSPVAWLVGTNIFTEEDSKCLSCLVTPFETWPFFLKGEISISDL